MSCPLIVQYALQNWANSFFQMLMSRSSCQLAAAYGSTTAFTNTVRASRPTQTNK
jgi:hypothetical protein